MSVYELKKPRFFNSFTNTLLVLALTLGYLGYWFMPHWWPIFQLTGIMRGACNNMYREYDDKKVLEGLLRESKRTGLKLTKDNFLLERVLYDHEEIATQPPHAKDQLQRRGKSCRIQMIYVVDSVLPFINKTKTLEFRRDITGDLAVIQY